MDITLEKIDIVRDRTGVSYKEAKDALEAADGNVVDALIQIEEAGNRKWNGTAFTESISVKGTEVVDKLKAILNNGNVSRIRVKKDEYVIMDIPVTAGAIGAVIIPQLTAIGAAVALLTKCTIEVERPNKEILNVNEVINNTAGDLTSKIKNMANDLKKTTSHTDETPQSNEENLEDQTYQTTVEFDTTIDQKDNEDKQ